MSGVSRLNGPPYAKVLGKTSGGALAKGDDARDWATAKARKILAEHQPLLRELRALLESAPTISLWQYVWPVLIMGVLLIPAGLSDAYAQSKQTIVTLLYDPTGDVNLRDQVQGVIKGATISISLEKQIMQGQQDMEDLTSIAPNEVQDAIATAADKSSNKDLKSAIAFTQIAPSNYLERKQPTPLQQAIPGYTVMFAFLVAGFMAGWSIEERLTIDDLRLTIFDFKSKMVNRQSSIENEF